MPLGRRRRGCGAGRAGALVLAALALAAGAQAQFGGDATLALGTLVKYGDEDSNAAFVTGRHTRHVVLLPELGATFFGSNYSSYLSDVLDGQGWSFVQPQLSSSGEAWGLASLEQDVADVGALLRTLGEDFRSEGVVLMGSGYGSHALVAYMQAAQRNQTAGPPVLGAILQSPVSTREWLAAANATAARLQRAQRMVAEGRGEEVLYREPGGAAVSASRYVALASKGSAQDFFSTDLADAQLKEIFAPLGAAPLLILMATQDEWVPDPLTYAGLGWRWTQAASEATTTAVSIADAPHGMDGHEDEVVGWVVGWLLTNMGAAPPELQIAEAPAPLRAPGGAPAPASAPAP